MQAGMKAVVCFVGLVLPCGLASAFQYPKIVQSKIGALPQLTAGKTCKPKALSPKTFTPHRRGRQIEAIWLLRRPCWHQDWRGLVGSSCIG